MAFCIWHFISYESNLMILKQNNKPLCKNLPKEFSTINYQQIEQNSVPIRVSMMGDLLMQRVNSEDGIIVEGTPI